MRSACVVQIHVLIDSPAGLRHRPELVIQKVFLLEDPIHTLRHSILSAMVFFGHTERQARLLQPIHVLMRAIWAATIGMGDRSSALGQAIQGHGERLERILGA